MTTDAEQWDAYHRDKNLAKLTGTSFETLREWLEIDRYVSMLPYWVLEVGVGTGDCIRGFVEAGSRVCAVDISRKALDRAVACGAEVALLPEQMEIIIGGSFSFAYCVNASQHMGDEDLQHIISETIRTLHTDGAVFRLHCVSNVDQRKNDRGGKRQEERIRGGVWRSREHVARMVEEAGGTITRYTDPVRVQTKHETLEGWICDISPAT